MVLLTINGRLTVLRGAPNQTLSQALHIQGCVQLDGVTVHAGQTTLAAADGRALVTPADVPLPPGAMQAGLALDAPVWHP